MEFYRYTEDTFDLFYRQYHRLTRTVTYLNFEMNFSFLVISLLILGLYSNLMFRKKLYLYVCKRINGIKGIVWISFTILVHSI